MRVDEMRWRSLKRHPGLLQSVDSRHASCTAQHATLTNYVSLLFKQPLKNAKDVLRLIFVGIKIYVREYFLSPNVQDQRETFDSNLTELRASSAANFQAQRAAMDEQRDTLLENITTKHTSLKEVCGTKNGESRPRRLFFVCFIVLCVVLCACFTLSYYVLLYIFWAGSKR